MKKETNQSKYDKIRKILSEPIKAEDDKETYTDDDKRYVDSIYYILKSLRYILKQFENLQ